VLAGIDLNAPTKLEIIQNNISQGELAANVEVPVELNDSEKTISAMIGAPSESTTPT
jgi:hypothetical protein